MKDLFATIYESVFGLFDVQYQLIFEELYENGGYLLLGFSFLTIPLLFIACFYFLWKYPYGRKMHYWLWLIITAIITGAISWGIASNTIFLSDNQPLNNALQDPQSGYVLYAKSLPPKYALINSGLSLVLGFLYSLILKQFSKIQIHLPF